MLFQDVKPLEVYSLAFVVDNTNIGFMASDKEKNLIIYTYQPEGESYSTFKKSKQIE